MASCKKRTDGEGWRGEHWSPHGETDRQLYGTREVPNDDSCPTCGPPPVPTHQQPHGAHGAANGLCHGLPSGHRKQYFEPP